VDVGWFSDDRFKSAFDRRCFLQAPEICVEIISPSNTREEMNEKMAIYFDAGAKECWLCEEDGRVRFFVGSGDEVAMSGTCPDFPENIPV
jgi:Uma2 family endonuclease